MTLQLSEHQEVQPFPKTILMSSTYITFVGLRIRMLLHVLIEIVLHIEDLIAKIANVRLLLAVFPHMREKFVEARESLIAHAAV